MNLSELGYRAQARSGCTRFLRSGRDPVASDLPRRRTGSSLNWKNCQKNLTATECVGGLIDNESTTRNVSPGNDSVQDMRKALNPTCLDNMDRENPNITDAREDMFRAHTAQITMSEHAVQPISDINAIEHTNEGVAYGTRSSKNSGAQGGMIRAPPTTTKMSRRVAQPLPYDLPIRRRPMKLSIAGIERARLDTSYTTESVDDRSRPVTRGGGWSDKQRALSVPTKRFRRANQPVPSDLPARRQSIEMSTTQNERARQGSSLATESVDDASDSATTAGAWSGIKRNPSVPTTRIRRVNEPVPYDLPVRRRPMDISMTEIERSHLGTTPAAESVDSESGSVNITGAWSGIERARWAPATSLGRVNKPVPSDLPVRRRAVEMSIAEIEGARLTTSLATENFDDASGSTPTAGAWSCIKRSPSVLTTRIRRANQPVLSDLPVRRRPINMSVTEMERTNLGTSSAAESVGDKGGSLNITGAWSGMERALWAPTTYHRRVNQPVPNDLPVRRRAIEMSIAEIEGARLTTSLATESVDTASGSGTTAGAWSCIKRNPSVPTTRIRRTNQPVLSDLLIRRRPIDVSVTEMERTHIGKSPAAESVDDGSGSVNFTGAWSGMKRALWAPTTSLRRVNQPVPKDLPVRRRTIEMSIAEIEGARLTTSLANESVDTESGPVTTAEAWSDIKQSPSVPTSRIKRTNQPVPSDLPIRRRPIDMSKTETERTHLGTRPAAESVDSESGSVNITGAWSGMERALWTPTTILRRVNKPVPSDLSIRRRAIEMFIAEIEGARLATSLATESVDDGRGSALKAVAWSGIRRTPSVPTSRIRRINQLVPSDLPVRRRTINMSITEIERTRFCTSLPTESVEDGSGPLNKVGTWSRIEQSLLLSTTNIRRRNQPVHSLFPIGRRPLDMSIVTIEGAHLSNSTDPVDYKRVSDIMNNMEEGNMEEGNMERTSLVPFRRSRRASQPIPNGIFIRRRPLDMSIAAVEGASGGTGYTTESFDNGSRSTTTDSLGGRRHTHDTTTASVGLNSLSTPSDLPRRKSTDVYATRSGDVDNVGGVIIDRTQRGDALETEEKMVT